MRAKNGRTNNSLNNSMLGTALGHQGPAAARPSELTGHDGRPLHENDIVPEEAAALGALEVQWVHP